jgi:hypothetical protein
MPTEIYKIEYIKTISGEAIEIIPLKIKYMKQLMSAFEKMKDSKNNEDALDVVCECARIAMKQYRPDLAKNIQIIQDNFDIKNLHELLDFSAGIKLNKKNEDNEPSKLDNSGSSWEELDLLKLETEVFMLGIWKSYDELESSLSVQELMELISARRELDYEEKKFLAAIQGINLDESSSDGKQRGQKEWEDMKARVFSNGQTGDSRDILALQGQNAKKAGFGIGMGLEYEDLRQTVQK